MGFYEEQLQKKCEEYALGLITEEGGEVNQLIGKAIRFGIDTPGVKDALTGVVDMQKTPRNMLEIELGDMMAAIRYAVARGVVSGDVVFTRSDQKYRKLMDPESKDNLGRRLAP